MLLYFNLMLPNNNQLQAQERTMLLILRKAGAKLISRGQELSDKVYLCLNLIIVVLIVSVFVLQFMIVGTTLHFLVLALDNYWEELN